MSEHKNLIDELTFEQKIEAECKRLIYGTVYILKYKNGEIEIVSPNEILNNGGK